MDRRQRKTREAIFCGFTKLLSQKDFNRITVGEICEQADVGRATFYAHFETKEYLLKAFCEELFCHLFDAQSGDKCGHKHIFDCDSTDAAFLHLFRHLQKNDNNILLLLSSPNNALFLSYFRSNLESLIDNQYAHFASSRPENVPESYYKNHIVSTLIETIRWWTDNKMKETPEIITEYFFQSLYIPKR